MDQEQKILTKEEWKKDDRRSRITTVIGFICLVIFALIAFGSNPIAALIFIPLLIILALFF